jgi:predicted ATPase
MAFKRIDDTRLIRSVTLRNILSFGPDTPALELGNLNVLVGPNGSGKSNLLDVLSLLAKIPSDPRSAMSKAGGVSEWIWKGDPEGAATIETVVARPGARNPIRHRFAFSVEQQELRIEDENVENGAATPPSKARTLYTFRNRQPLITVNGALRKVTKSKFDPTLSILAQRADPERYPEIAHLASSYEKIRLYLGWPFGRTAPLRRPQASDLPSRTLQENFHNLGLVLNRYRRDPATKAKFIERLRDLYDGLTDFDVMIEGGTVQVFFSEGDRTIPATRLSDGSVRYLCLLAILLHPAPPPLIGIEEPELGLHPDLIPKVGALLVEASKRTQVIVTTHSDILVDALSDHPESLVIFEREDGRTTMSRPNPIRLRKWLAKSSLGQLWTEGQLGGTRW